MDFYTFILRKSGNHWVAMCLENGIAGQGKSKDRAVEKLREAIESFKEVFESEENVYHAPVSIKELHEFLTIEEKEPESEIYELRAMHA